MNHLIVFCNLKGGVGKSTLCALFATFLAQQGERVMVVDADLQQSILWHRKEDLRKSPDAEIPWTVNSIDELGDLNQTLPRIKGVDGWILIDCPGNLNDNNLLPIFRHADFAVVPVYFDVDTVHSTEIFLKTFRKVSSAKILLQPNRIRFAWGKNKTFDQQTIEAKKTLGAYGETSTPRIPESVDIERYSTILPLTSEQRGKVYYAFNFLKQSINK